MTLDTGVVRTLVGHEILMLLRDRRTLLLSVVLPLLLMPLMLFGSQIMEKQRQQRLQTAEYLVHRDRPGGGRRFGPSSTARSPAFASSGRATVQRSASRSPFLRTPLAR